MTCDDHCSSAASPTVTVIAHEIKSSRDNQCVCFSFIMLLIRMELSRLSVADLLHCVCISGLFVQHHRVYIYSHIYFYIGKAVALFFLGGGGFWE